MNTSPVNKCSVCKTRPTAGLGTMCQPCLREWVTRWIREGVERGTHSVGVVDLERCSSCGEWKPRWARHKQFARIYICRECDPGDAPQEQKHVHLAAAEDEKPIDTTVLIDGLANLVSFDHAPDFEEYAAALAGTLEQIMADPWYIDPICTLWPGELMQLSPWMQPVGGMLPPGRMGWFEWINSVQVAP